jgi:hypothetical protein
MELNVQLQKGMEKVVNTNVTQDKAVVGKVVSYNPETGIATLKMNREWKLPENGERTYSTDF